MALLRPTPSHRPLGLVLFDIDGTLVEGSRTEPSAGMVAMGRAASEVTGEALRMTDVDFAGQTDVNIAIMLVEAAGQKASRQTVARLLERYLHYMSIEIAHLPYFALGDPAGAVAALRSAGFIVGLGTGNLKKGAQMKLESAGLADHFDIELGGYADDGVNRADVLAAAQARCDASRSLPAIIIGDTDHDVHAAHSIGGECIGVPFRRSTADSLRLAGAAAVVDEVGPQLRTLCLRLVQSSLRNSIA